MLLAVRQDSTVSFESNSGTSNIILHKNLEPLNNVTILPLNIVLARRCGLFTDFQKII